MTTQVVSFLVFALAFIILFLFYKKEDRKKILIISGVFFLTPFSFSFFQISGDYGLLVLPLATGFLMLFRFVKSHYRYFSLFFCFYFFGIVFTTRHVTIINNEGAPSKKLLLTSSLDFSYKSGVRVIVPIEGGELINNTDSRLYVETVEYGNSFYGSGNNNQIIKEIEPFSYTRINYSIDYFFQDPPTTINISRKQGETMPDKETKYWLHN
jgi:hypothetical protein